MTTAPPSKKSTLYLQVLVGIFAGVLVGRFFPHFGAKLEPLGQGFIRLIKMLVAPIVFSTVVAGIASAGDLKRVGRLGIKALAYFEILTTVALVIGLVVMHFVNPGRGMNVDASTLDASSIEKYQKSAEPWPQFLLHMIPESVIGSFASGDIIGVLLFSVLFGVALSHLGNRGKPIVDLVERFASALFAIVEMIMRLAPIGAFGAMAFTVSSFGLESLENLGELMLAFYITAALFVVVVLGSIVRLIGLSPARLFSYLKDEFFLVLGTSSSETALPRMMEKLEALGCERGVVRLVIPTGYSFNLDGTCIYLTMATLFLAEATNTHLSLGEELAILGVLLLSSKGAAAVTGGGFITLAATLGSTGRIPVAALALLVGIDRFMSEVRALTNLLGNGVATIVVARWEGQLDLERAKNVLSRRAASEPVA